MGEVIVSGPDADRYINHIFTNDVTGTAGRKVLYGMLCYPDGGVVDDTCICKLDERLYLMTINAANIDKDMAWIRQNAEGFDVIIETRVMLTDSWPYRGRKPRRRWRTYSDLPART